MAYALTKDLSAIRRTSAPLVAVCSVDSPSTLHSIKLLFPDTIPMAVWDVVQGVQQLTGAGADIIQALSQKGNPTNPVELLKNAMHLPPKSILFVMNMHLFFAQPGTVQGLANLRDVLKARGSTLIVLSPALKLPLELAQDIIVLEEPLPDTKALGKILAHEHTNFVKSTGLDLTLDVPTEDRATDALRGLGSFAAEAEIAMAMTKDGLDVQRLWQRKQQVIAQTPGLSVYKGTETFANVGGLDTIKTFLRQVLQGRKKPRALAWIDEIEKCLAGMHGDNTGVSQDFLGALLTYMQETDTQGVMLLGPSGTGKSFIAKTAGNEAGIPTVSLDLGAMKDAHVGASERNMRTAFKVLNAISDGAILLVATSNNIAILPPELRRRFRLGTWVVDLPTVDEQREIWRVQLAKYPDLLHLTLPVHCDNWTGADIAQCAELAWALDITLTEASQYIVPVAISAKEEIERLRAEAAGRYLSASYPGLYQQPQFASVNSTRQYTL